MGEGNTASRGGRSGQSQSSLSSSKTGSSSQKDKKLKRGGKEEKNNSSVKGATRRAHTNLEKPLKENGKVSSTKGPVNDNAGAKPDKASGRSNINVEKRGGSGRRGDTARKKGCSVEKKAKEEVSREKNGKKVVRASFPSEIIGQSKETCFPEHFDLEEMANGISSGSIFSGVFRVNAGARNEGFVTLKGLPNDVFIPGACNQNRAIEGDKVALRIKPPSEWYPPKGARKNSAILNSGKEGIKSNAKSSKKNKKKNGTQRGQHASEAGSTTTAYNVPPSMEGKRIRQMTPPVWLGYNTDIVASPSMMVSPSGGDLAMTLVEDGNNDQLLVARTQEDQLAENCSDSLHTMLDPVSTVDFLVQTFQKAHLDPKVHDKKVEDATWKTLSTSPTTANEERFRLASPDAGGLDAINSLLISKEFKGWRPTAEVVGILEPSPRRQNIVGVFRYDGDRVYVMPCDPRMPPLQVDKGRIQEQGLHRLLEEAAQSVDGMQRTLVSSALKSWKASEHFPYADQIRVIGLSGNLQCETKAILEAEQIKDDDGFNEEVLECLPSLPWKASEADLADRRDFRDHRVFSIDPPTARDLDDALSIEVLDNGLFRIGVHIADVSYFVRPGTALDVEASERSTSVYLVDRVIPMLPRPLCEDLCSLNPGVDRLCMSIVWDMNSNGDIRKTWMGRTVIHSCAKLSYPHVQEMIEKNALGKDACLKPEEVNIHGSNSWEDIVADCLRLHSVAQNLRRRRFTEGGALRLDNTRLYFDLDSDGNPVSYGVYEQKDANRLVEEFMLKANMSAAEFISQVFPQRALLRSHPPPNAEKMQEIPDMIARLLPDMPSFKVSSAHEIYQSLISLQEALYSNPETASDAGFIMDVVTLLCTKPMQLAKYFCTGDEPDEFLWRHYALSVEYYTHFTSPIRRYPDILVHRLILAALDVVRERCEMPLKDDSSLQVEVALVRNDTTGGDASPDDDDEDEGDDEVVLQKHQIFDTETISRLAAHANDRKLAAKNAQDGALKLYLASFLLEKPQVFEGIVANLGGHLFFDVYIPDLGMDVRVWTADALKGGQKAIDAKWNAAESVLRLSLPPSSTRDGTDAQPDYSDVPSITNLTNPKNLSHCQLPLELRALSRLPLVLGGRRSEMSGSPSGLLAKIFFGPLQLALNDMTQ